jgi:hypothetical protein
MKLLLSLLALVLTSCGSSVILDGSCVLSKVEKDNNTYYVGPCLDSEGQIEKVKVRWQNDEGIDLRATVARDGAVKITYRTDSGLNDSGIWVSWSPKSGVMLGAVPVEIVDVVEESPPTVDTEELLEDLSDNQ